MSQQDQTLPPYDTRLGRIDRTIARSDRRLRPSEVELLRIVGTHETPDAPARITQDVLARRLGMRRESVCKLAGRLEARGLLVTSQERQPNGRWGQVGYRLPEAWDEAQRHTVNGVGTSHGEQASSAAFRAGSSTATSHGDRGENVTTSIGMRLRRLLRGKSYSLKDSAA